jgi:hypothetical protein
MISGALLTTSMVVTRPLIPPGPIFRAGVLVSHSGDISWAKEVIAQKRKRK